MSSKYKFPFLRSLLFLMGGILLLSFSFFGSGGLTRVLELDRDLDKLEQRVATKVIRKEKIGRDIGKMQTDNTMLERVAREELGLKRSGEVVYTFSASNLEGSSE